MSKIFFIDSDETLRRSDGTISKRTKEAIKNVRRKGHYVIICTGRPRYHTLEIMEECGATPIIVSSNGSEIYDAEKNMIIDSLYINNKECIKLCDLCNKYSLRIIFTVANCEYATKYLKNNNQILLNELNYEEILGNKKIKQCLISSDNVIGMNEVKKYIDSSKEFKLINGNQNFSEDFDNWLSVGSLKSSKGYGLTKLAKHLNIPIENTFAIGNDFNDISMLDTAGISICVSNAHEKVKMHANYITKSNDEDGVALVLEEFMKKEI